MTKNTPETNPFVQALEISCVWKLKKIPFSSSTEGHKTYAEATLLDRENRASVYTDHLLHWFKDLPASAKDMFMYISHKLGFETDVIELREEKYCEEMNVSRSTFHLAKTALTNRLIIPRTSRKHTYWINPAYLYKGERLKQFPGNAVPVNQNPLEKAEEVT